MSLAATGPEGQALDDDARLQALRATGLLDSLPEPSFDRFARIIAHFLDVPVAQVALVDDHRQYFKSRLVLDGSPEPRQTGLERSFCRYVVQSGEPLVVEDSRTDPLLVNNPASTEDQVIAYCGVPVRLTDGTLLGSLCAIDRVPRGWSTQDLEVLEDISAMVVTEIELRLAAEDVRRRSAALADASRGVRTLQVVLDETAAESEHARKVSLDLAATVAHELRTPLFAIRGLAEVMRAERPAGTLSSDLAMIDSTAQEALELVDEQLQLARAEAGKVAIHPHDLSIDDALAALRGMMTPVPRAPGVALEFAPAPADAPLMHTDPGKLAQILRNLVANALRHTTEGSVRVAAALQEGGTRVSFTVTDTGCGIAAADLERIFEPFTRVGVRSEDGQGTGLGLPLARKLADLLDGTVTVRSVTGAGSTFTATVATRYGDG